jgi:DNA-binding transcriptional LysR family regulator
MALQKYQALRAVVETGSFSGAAEALGYSQSSVSRMVSDLESEWGIRLLNRGRSGASLTDEGARVYPAVLRLCASEDDLSARVNDLKGLTTGTLRIGTISSIATHWLPEIISAFHDDYPGIECELLLGNYTEIEHWLETGRVDCGFLRLPASRSLEARALAEDQLFAVLPKGHELARHSSITAEMLAAHPYLSLSENADVEDADIFSRLQQRPAPVLSTWDDYCIMAMVERHVGISVLPGLILKRIPYELEIRPLDPPVYRTLGFARRHEQNATLAVARFEEYLDLIPT